MIPRLVPEISPCDGFCDGQGAVVAGLGYSSKLICMLKHRTKITKKKLESAFMKVTFCCACMYPLKLIELVVIHKL